MWSDGRGPWQDYTGILPSTSNRQEKERKQEEGTETKKINIGAGIRGALRDRCIADEKRHRQEDDRGKHSIFVSFAFTLFHGGK